MHGLNILQWYGIERFCGDYDTSCHIVFADDRSDSDVRLDIQNITSQVSRGARDQASIIDTINKLETVITHKLEHKIEAVKEDITSQLEIMTNKLENNAAMLESFKHLIASQIPQASQASEAIDADQASMDKTVCSKH